MILIVDDNMYFVERIISLLDQVVDAGDIDVASDYNEAYHLLAHETPNIVLLDINLPGKSGIELLKKIKESGDKCRVIMFTNHADEYYRHLCKELGADHFLDKSNDFGKIPGLIGQLYN